MGRLVSLSLLSLLLCATLLASCAEDEELSAGRVKVAFIQETRYYQVHGTSTDAIFESLAGYGFRDSDGRDYLGMVSGGANYGWKTRERTDGCSIASMTITFAFVMTLPEHILVSLLTPGLLARWRVYSDDAAAHEQGHMEIYKEGAAAMQRSMLAIGPKPSCALLEKEIVMVWSEQFRRIEDRQEQYDVQDNAAREAQRTAVKDRLERTAAELQLLSSRLEELQQHTYVLEGEAGGIERRLRSEMEAIEDAYQRNPAMGILDEYKSMRHRYNSLLSEWDSIFEDYKWLQ